MRSRGDSGDGSAGEVHKWDCLDRSDGSITTVSMKNTRSNCQCPKCSNPEKNSISENAEYFTGCSDSAAIKATCEGDQAFATNDYGTPGMDFKDWVSSQAVDPQVLKNHAEFVKDRLDVVGSNITGRTYDPGYRLGEMEGSDAVPWIGIRGRPQNVKICNPTQLTDFNENSYTDKPKLTWSST